MSLRFDDLALRFLSWAKKCRRPSTVAVYRHYLMRFCQTFPDLIASDISPAMVSEWARTWHEVQAMKRLYVWAKDEALLIPSNPIAGVKAPPKGERRRIFERSELVSMLRQSKTDCRRLLIAYRETLARPQELRVATWDDVRSIDPTVHLRHALVAGAVAIVLYEFKNRADRKDTAAPRVILLSPRACRLLVRLYDRRPTATGPIFLTRRGRAWTANALRCRFRVLRRKLNVTRDGRGETLVPYTFRHTGATIAAAKGVRDRMLADVLGHVETKTTARYQHLQREHLIDAMRAVWTPTRRTITTPQSESGSDPAVSDK